MMYCVSFTSEPTLLTAAAFSLRRGAGKLAVRLMVERPCCILVDSGIHHVTAQQLGQHSCNSTPVHSKCS
jgi:hypothetical protein